MSKALHRLGLFLAAILPWPFNIIMYRCIYSYSIPWSCRVGFSYIDSIVVQLGPNCRIGHFNRFTGLNKVLFGSDSSCGNFNAFTGARGLPWVVGGANLELGCGVSITSRHLFDCSGGLSVGDFTTFAGAYSIAFTHGIDVANCLMQPASIHIGRYCLIAARVTLLPGLHVGDQVVVAAGSVLPRTTYRSRVLVAGNPAIIKREYSGDELYFTRKMPRL